MVFKYVIIFLLFFIVSLLQVSFFPYFNILGASPDLVFILFFILIFSAQENENYDVLFFAITAGFFSDILLLSYFGLSMVSFLAAYCFKKLIVHFMKEARNKYLVFYFIPVFSACFVLHRFVLYVFSIFLHFEFNFGSTIFISLMYNLVFACIGFYAYRKAAHLGNTNRQLKLFN